MKNTKHNEEAIHLRTEAGGGREQRAGGLPGGRQDGKSLSSITLSMAGALSDADQRKEFGVTKPWPPQ